MSQQQPFTWVVKFTVAPAWVADGFSICDERAHSMLAHELGGAYNTEISAQVLEAPNALHIADVQGYVDHKDNRVPQIAFDLDAGTPNIGKLRTALVEARSYLGRVRAPHGSRAAAKRVETLLTEALALIDPRQGAPVEVE